MSDADRPSEPVILFADEPRPDYHVHNCRIVGKVNILHGRKCYHCDEVFEWCRNETTPTTTDAPEGANEPPPLPAPHVEVLRWQEQPSCIWRAVAQNGSCWQWVDSAAAWFLRAEAWAVDEARRRLAKALAAERAARAAQLEAAYREAHAAGRLSLQGGSIDGTVAANADWLDSHARAALGEGAK